MKVKLGKSFPKGRHSIFSPRERYVLARLRSKRWKAANRELVNGYAKKAYAKDPEKHRAISRDYRKKNPDKIKEANHKAYMKNPAFYKERLKKWNREHPECQRKHHQRRKALLRGAKIGDLKKIQEWEMGWKSENSVQCYWCLQFFHPKECHTDHVIALAIGGRHELYNLVISCAPCNLRKKAKPPLVWMKEIGRVCDRIWCH